MNDNGLSRRRLMRVGLGAAATAGLVSIPGASLAQACEPGAVFCERDRDVSKASFDNAYSFLNTMMDAYAQGATTRLIQSYPDQMGLQSTAFVYDNALALMAYLLRGDVARAKVIGDGLLYAQTHDPNFADGRVRQAYFVNAPDANNAFVQLAGWPFWFVGSAVGDMAWSGMALAQLYTFTREQKYLGTATTGAIGLGNFIQNFFYDTRGAGGYNYGLDNAWPQNVLRYKSTEHNIDCYALFGMLARLTGSGFWSDCAQHALTFVKAMYNSTDGFFWTGTGPDGVSFSTDQKTSNIPEDVQTWSYLAMLDKDYAAAIDWAKTNLEVTDTPQALNSSLAGKTRVNGVSYASLAMHPPIAGSNLAPSDPYSPPPDPAAVWLEGSAHLAAALLARNVSRRDDLAGYAGDGATASALLENIRVSQDKLGNGQTVGGNAIADGCGVQAATSFLNTGFGYSYKPFKHIGASSWYLIAGQSANPFLIGMRNWR